MEFNLDDITLGNEADDSTHDLSKECEHALRLDLKNDPERDGRNGELLKSTRCKVCGHHDTMNASTASAYRHGCKKCWNHVNGLPFFPARDKDWFTNRGSKASRHVTWKMFTTTYRKEMLALGLCKPTAALVLEYMADRQGQSGVVRLNKSDCQKMLNVGQSAVEHSLDTLTKVGAIVEMSPVLGMKKGARKSYSVLLSPLKDSKQCRNKNRLAAFVTSVVPERNDSKALAAECTERFKVGEASSKPITDA